MSATCTAFRALGSDDAFWRPLYVSRFPSACVQVKSGEPWKNAYATAVVTAAKEKEERARREAERERARAWAQRYVPVDPSPCPRSLITSRRSLIIPSPVIPMIPNHPDDP